LCIASLLLALPQVTFTRIRSVTVLSRWDRGNYATRIYLRLTILLKKNVCSLLRRCLIPVCWRVQALRHHAIHARSRTCIHGPSYYIPSHEAQLGYRHSRLVQYCCVRFRRNEPPMSVIIPAMAILIQHMGICLGSPACLIISQDAYPLHAAFHSSFLHGQVANMMIINPPATNLFPRYLTRPFRLFQCRSSLPGCGRSSEEGNYFSSSAEPGSLGLVSPAPQDDDKKIEHHQGTG
jgi:hypothetical protein